MATASPSRSQQLRGLIQDPTTLVAPGAQDAISALLVEEEGFDAVFVGDYNGSAVLLGRPDYGLVTLDEMASLLRRVASVTSIPVIGDGGCGFGNPLNVMRTIEAYEGAGVAGVTLEDQVYPKRCGHMEGKAVIGVEEMETKLRAAQRAREDPDLVIIARTDSIHTDGLEEAIRRGRRFAEAGADAFWADAVSNLDDLQRLVEEVPLPIQVAMIEGGKTPLTKTQTLQELGVAVELCGLTTLYAAAGGIRKVLRALREDGDTRAVLDSMIIFDEFNELVGLPAMVELDRDLASTMEGRAEGSLR